MKRFLPLLALIMPLNPIAMAADSPAIGFVDVRKVMLESKVGKKNKAEFDKLVKDKETTLGKEEEKLKALQDSLQKDQLMMTEEQRRSRQREFQEKAEAFQKMLRDAKQEVGRKDNEYTAKALEEIRIIVADLAKTMNLSMVLEVSESGLLYADKKLDLTAKVMEKYDAKAK